MAPKAATDVLDDLVHQFTDPFAFYRELIQNSIDAGSSRIEVCLSFRPGRGQGLCTAQVTDWGEGMSRATIEGYLVTKFKSTKENDLTKIGKFGIGFMSVFACAPDLVVVETGRDGEAHRVLFKPDKTYELLKLPDLVEGTRVVLHKSMPADEYDAFVARSRAAVRLWCVHSEVEVAFAAGGADGSPAPALQPVRAPVVVDAPYQVEHREEGTLIVAGPARAEAPVTGFYNRGLTLMETQEPLFPGVAVKVISRFLEHTITRDNVRRDGHFDRVVKLTRALIDGPLTAQLPQELEKAAERADGSRDWATLFDFGRRVLKPSQLTYRAVGGGAIAQGRLREALQAEQALLFSVERTPVTERLRVAGVPVLEGEATAPRAAQLKLALRAATLARADDFFAYAEPPEGPQPTAFLEALRQLLQSSGGRVEAVAVAELRGGVALEPWALFDALGRPRPAQACLGSVRDRPAPRLLCLNRTHVRIASAVPLFTRAPRLAALLMARMVLVSRSQLDQQTDLQLTEAVLR